MGDIIIIIFHLIVCIFEIWMIFDFFSTFLKGKSKTKKNTIVYIVIFALIVFAVNCLDNTIVNLLLVPITYLLLAIVAFKGKIYRKVFGALIGTTVILGTELIVVAVLNITSEELIKSSMVDEPSAVILTVIVKMVTFIIFVMIKRFSSKDSDNMDRETFLLYIIVPLSSLGIMFSVVFCEIDFVETSLAKQILVAFCFMLMIGNATIFYGYNRYARVLVEKEENRRIVIEQKMELESYQKVHVANDKYLTLLHDTNHQMKAVYSLLVKGQKEEAIDMLKSLSDEYEKSEMIEYSSNTILNAILSDYKEKADKENIQCDIFVERGFNIEYVEDIDLVAMISNLLLNAYEAAVKSDKKKIKVQMFMQNDGSFSVVKIINSFDGMIKKDGEILVTSKSDKNMHGFGVKSIEKTAEKYNGWLVNTWEDNKFKTVLVLENSMY